jgi:hypothetical protein
VDNDNFLVYDDPAIDCFNVTSQEANGTGIKCDTSVDDSSDLRLVISQ